MDDLQKLKLFSLTEELMGIGHWHVDLVANSIYWSDQIYKIHGVSPDTYTPNLASAIDFYHPGDKRRVMTLVERAIDMAENFEFSLRIVRPSKEIRHVVSKAQCEIDSNGNVIRIFGVFLDVTDNVKVNLTEAAHNTLIESTNDGYWDWHIQDNYEYMSPRFWEMLGYNPSEKKHLPEEWQGMIFEEDLKTALHNFDRHVSTHGVHPYSQEVRFRHKNGSTVTVLCRGKVIEWSADGTPLRMIGTHTDITTIKEAEKKLREQLEFQELLLNVNEDFIFVKDSQFRIVTANNAFLGLYPKAVRNHILGTTTVEDYPLKQAEEFLAEDRKALTNGFSEVIETINFPNGDERTLLTKKVRFTDGNGAKMILGVARDITELSASREALRQTNEELEEFAYRTSHDLRSPLISTRRLLDFIKRDLERNRKDSALQNIGVVQTSLKKLDDLVVDILQLTRLKFLEDNKAHIALGNVIDDAISKLKQMEGFDRVDFRKNIDIESGVFVYEKHLVPVIENLLSNAIKYQDFSKSSSWVEFDAKKQLDTLIITISDNGIGIPLANHKQLFTMFKRFHPKASFGSGLGLYMVKKSVERMEGTIRYEPLEEGSKFIIRIPCSE